MSQLKSTAQIAPLKRSSRQPILLTIVDAGLMATLVLAPFLMGGRQAIGQLAICLLATITALAWCLHQCRHGDGRLRFTGVEPIMLLGLGLVVLQCWELTPELIRALSPRVPRLLSEWNETSPLFPTSWNWISFTPGETWSYYVILVASIEFFFILVQRLQTVDDVQRFVRAVALGGAAMSAFGLVQHAFGNGKFFWFYEHPMATTFGAARGAFTNPDHFANYLALTLPAQLLMLLPRLNCESVCGSLLKQPSKGSVWKSTVLLGVFWGCCVVVTVCGIIFARSATGLGSAVLGVVLALAIFWHKSILNLRQAGIGMGILFVVLLLVPVLQRNTRPLVDNKPRGIPLEAQVSSSDKNKTPWKANLQGIGEFPLAGTGLGSHQEVYGLWFHSSQSLRDLRIAQNGYLQVALETGLTGLGLVVLLWLTSLLWCAQGLWNSMSTRGGGLMAVVTSGLLMSLAQSVSESVWYVPACVNIVLMYGVAAWRISLMRFFEPGPVTRRAVPNNFGRVRLKWVAALPVVLLLGTWMVKEKLPEFRAEPYWNQYLRLTFTQQRQDGDDPDSNQELLEQRIELALKSAAANPRAHQPQLHAGLACLKKFTLSQAELHRQMPLSQIRDAARTLFESPEDMNRWLDRPGVLGAERKLLEDAIHHFQASLAACPLQPRPYLELAELVWLEGGSEDDERHLIEQAVAVRPGNSRAHFAMGRILWLEGAQKDAAVHWQNAFRFDPDYRSQLIGVLADYVPARFFLDHFEPDHSAMKQLRLAYKDSDDSAGYQLVLDSLAKSCVKKAIVLRGDAAAAEWMLAHECFAEIGDRKNAYHSAKEAVVAAPDLYESHQLFGLWLYRNGMFSDAIPELSWCIARRPDESWLQTLAQDAEKHHKAHPDKQQFATEPRESVIR